MSFKRQLIVAAVCALMGLYGTLLVLDLENVKMLAREDGLVEWIGAISFFISAVILLIVYVSDITGNNFFIFKTKRNIFYLILGILLLFGAGEEISWGQRLLQIDTPEWILSLNIQGELNIHNLEYFHGINREGDKKNFFELLLNIDRLFSLFWFNYCFMLPVMKKAFDSASDLINRINLPLPGIIIGALFLLNYASSKAFEAIMNPGFSHSIVEIKETGFSVLFLVISLSFYCERKKRKPVMEKAEIFECLR